jgi:hypothetical protein
MNERKRRELLWASCTETKGQMAKGPSTNRAFIRQKQTVAWENKTFENKMEGEQRTLNCLHNSHTANDR